MWIEPVTFGGGSAIENVVVRAATVGPGIFGAEQVLVVPGFRPALFDFLRLVRFRYFLRHRSLHAKIGRNLNQ